MAGSDSPERWELESSEVVHEFPIYDVRRDRVRSPRTGEIHDFYIADAPDAVTIVAVTAMDELVMVEQFRHGIRELTLEMAGGILEGDDPVEGARRELREETGYESPDVTLLGVLEQNPSWETTLVHVALARGAVRSAEKDEDAGEDTRVRRIPRGMVREMIAGGEIRNAIAIAAFQLFDALDHGLDDRNP